MFLLQRAWCCVAVVAGLVLSGHALQAQSLTDAEQNTLKVALSGQQMVLRGYSAGPIVEAEVSDGKLIFTPSERKVLAVFTLGTTELKNEYLVLNGTQQVYARADGTRMLSKTNEILPLTILIYLPSVPDQATLPGRLKGELFFASLQEAYSSIPEEQKPCLPEVYSRVSKSLIKPPVCKVSPEALMTKPPKVIFQANLTSPAYMVSDREHWKLILSLTVNKEGKPESVHIAVPAYLLANAITGEPLSEQGREALDSSAIAAMKQYRFQPASRDGTVISSHLFIAVIH